MPYAVIIIVISAVAFVIFRAINSHFVCPKCGANFKINALEYIFAPHFMTKRMVTCPKCGHSELMTPYWDKNNPFGS